MFVLRETLLRVIATALTILPPATHLQPFFTHFLTFFSNYSAFPQLCGKRTLRDEGAFRRLTRGIPYRMTTSQLIKTVILIKTDSVIALCKI